MRSVTEAWARRVVAVCVGIGGVAGAVNLALVRDQDATTYVGSSQALLAAAVAVLLALIAAAASAAVSGQLLLALMLTVLAATWHVPELAGWVGSPSELRSVASAVPLVLLPIVVLATALAAGARTRRLLFGTVVLTVLCLAAAVTYDAFEDPGCWRSCQPPAWSSGGPSVPAGIAFTVAAALVLLTLAGSGGRSLRAASAIAAGTLALAGLAALRAVPGPDYPPHVFGWILAELGVLTLAACVVIWRARAAAMSRRLAGLADELLTAGDAEDLTAVLRDATGEPDLAIRWWCDELGIWVDAAGEPAEVEPPYTAVTRGDRLVAGVSHSRRIDASTLGDALGPALRLSLENAALRASRLAELAELRACRLRIVEQGDRERRALERNLHDGAQQRVVTLALALRLAARCAKERAREPASLERLAHAQHLVEELLSSLRQIAHGVHPAVLDDGGLVPAVMEYTDGLQQLRVSVRAKPGEARFSRPLELTAFLAVAETLDDAERRGAAVAEVTITRRGDRLLLAVRDDAEPDAVRSPHTASLRERMTAFADVLDLEVGSRATRTGTDLDRRGALCES